MTLIKTSLLNGIAVVIKMLTLLGLNKILAIYVGPAGYAALGQFQNAVQMITTFASGALNTGVTKYTAEYYEDEASQHVVWRTAGMIALIGSLATAGLVIIFNQSLAGWFLKDESLGSVFIWFAATLVLFVFNTLLLAILNGKKEIRRYVVANIAGSVFSLVVTSVMAIRLGLYGALVALAIYQSLTFFVTFMLTYKAPWFKFRYLLGGIDKQAAKNLGKYTVMALTSAACVPVSHILIRNHLGETLGWDVAGNWEALWRLSGAYMMLFMTTLSVYFLPKYAEIKSITLIKKELFKGYSLLLPFFILLVLFIYVFQDFLIVTIFTKEFLTIKDALGWQLFGDVLKFGSWMVAFLMHSKGLYKLFVVSEVLFSILFYFLAVYLSSTFGFKGMGIAHAINYAAYWIFVIFSVFHVLKKISDPDL
tara:strand:+ start:6451 stop:7716 length:1266 start_codon:yes stop_codon:yes gene_type:complete